MSESTTAGQRLRALRGGVSRQKVAADLDISERTLIRHEMGQTPLREVHVRVYAAYYGVDPEELRSAA